MFLTGVMNKILVLKPLTGEFTEYDHSKIQNLDNLVFREKSAICQISSSKYIVTGGNNS